MVNHKLKPIAFRVVTGLVSVALVLFIMSCQENTSTGSDEGFTTIDIQPFIGISKDRVIYVVDQLSKIYPHVELKQPIQLPRLAYYPGRNRYRADSVLRFLASKTTPGHITIGLTDKDISTTKGSVLDWGVMGLGYCPGKACVVSMFRLSVKEMNTQLFKISIHELGHTHGLPHCPVKSCFMRDAEGSNHTNEETGFCTNCKQRMIDKGWLLN